MKTVVISGTGLFTPPYSISNDELVIREVMTLTVSADHRVVDGEVMSRFLRDVADVLEDPITLLY